MTKLNLYVETDDQVAANLVVLIESLLKVGQSQNILNYRLHTASCDDIVEIGEDDVKIERYSTGKVKRITPELETYICRMHVLDGLDDYEIAKTLKMGQETVSRILGKHGFNKARKPPMTREEIDEVIRLYVEDGMSATKISRKLGRALNTIGKHLKDAGVMTNLTMEEIAEQQNMVRRVVTK